MPTSICLECSLLSVLTNSQLLSGGARFLCAYYCTTSFLCLSGLAQSLYLWSLKCLSVVSDWRVQSGMCLPVHRFLSGGAQFGLPVPIVHLVCRVCWGPNSYVLTIAPCLSVSVLIGPNFVLVLTSAPRLRVSAWRVQSGIWSPMHHFCLEGPNSVSCAQ